MFSFNLVPRKKSDSVFTLAMSRGFRILFGAITLILGAGMLSLGIYSWFSVLIFIISFLASVYNETWLFDKAAGTAEHRFGLLFLFRKKIISFSDIREIEIKQFVKGSIAGEKPSADQPPEEETGSGRTDARGAAPERKKGFLLPPFLFIELNLILEDGQSVNVETIKSRHVDFFRSKAEMLADFIEKPLEIREKI